MNEVILNLAHTVEFQHKVFSRWVRLKIKQIQSPDRLRGVLMRGMKVWRGRMLPVERELNDLLSVRCPEDHDA